MTPVKRWGMVSSTVTATVVAVALAVALFLRPSRIVELELPVPAHIPPEVRAALKARMERHGSDMRELIMRLVVLDNDGAARIAGAIFDNATAGYPGAGSSSREAPLEKFLPRRFFVLEDQLKTAARQIVADAARRDSASLAEHFGALTKTCVLCHQAYLFERPTDIPAESR